MDPALKNSAQALLLSCHLQPRASRSALCGHYGDRLKIALNAPPVDGKANAALIAFVAELFGVAKSQVTLASGLTSRDKTLKINNLDWTEADKILAAALANLR